MKVDKIIKDNDGSFAVSWEIDGRKNRVCGEFYMFDPHRNVFSFSPLVYTDNKKMNVAQTLKGLHDLVDSLMKFSTEFAKAANKQHSQWVSMNESPFLTEEDEWFEEDKKILPDKKTPDKKKASKKKEI